MSVYICKLGYSSVLASQKIQQGTSFSSGCVVRLVFCFFACAVLMPKKLSSVENFCLFEHMIACLKALENVAIKQNITTDGMLLASAL